MNSPSPPRSDAVRSSTGELAIMDDQQLSEAKAYSRAELKCDVMDRITDVAYLALTMVVAVPLDGWLQSNGSSQRSVRLLLMYLILTFGHLLVSFPLSFFSGHILEHRYQLSHQTWRAWLWRYTKRSSLTLFFGALLSLLLYQIIWRTGEWWWLVAAGAYFAISVLLGQLAPVVILPLFYQITRVDDETMRSRFGQLSEGTGLTVEGVYRMSMSDETAKANAMLAGLGATRRVILGDTLLDGFTPEEIDVIFAHEVGHHVHRHLLKLIIVGLLYSLGSFYVCDLALRAWVTFQGTSFSYGELPVYTLPCFTLSTTLIFMLLEPLNNGLSRHFERQADRYALQRTQSAAAYRSAFIKLARLNKADPAPHPLEVFWFHSHPPIAERLQTATSSRL